MTFSNCSVEIVEYHISKIGNPDRILVKGGYATPLGKEVVDQKGRIWKVIKPFLWELLSESEKK